MPDRKRLTLRCDGSPAQAAIELDGEPLSFVSRVELVLDANGAAEVRITLPGELVDVDADVQAFVTAHAAGGDDESASTHEPTVFVGLSGVDQQTIDAAVRRVLRHERIASVRR
jgi:hypothetical protein